MSEPVAAGGRTARDTIAAVATPVGRGGIAVVRVSGPQAGALAAKLLGKVPPPRQASAGIVRDASGEALDEVIALYFQAPHSYTGEDVLEIQGHGGPVVASMVLQACLDAGARIADPGEFTRRAFLEGRIDLAQAEAVADLIDAVSKNAARAALRSLRGEFSRAVQDVGTNLTELRVYTEAMLDFPEEEVEPVHGDVVRARLASLLGALDDLLRRSEQGSVLRQGVHVVLAGRPNVGKSSLLNRLAGDERAIVTPLAGTTRDALRETILIDGVPFVVTDTAGLREALDEIERLGIARTHAEIARADVVLMVVDASTGMTPEERDLVGRFPADVRRLDVFNKIDLLKDPGALERAEQSGAACVSAKTGAGMDVLEQRLLALAGWVSDGQAGYLAHERHLRALTTAREHLGQARDTAGAWELIAEDMRLAQRALGSITGEVTADELLGHIFSRFCIGK